ncbi:MAG: creatininase family protein [Myxococcales bacterium]|nr:creatininase family protein [Myxococcales bacterium]
METERQAAVARAKLARRLDALPGEACRALTAPLPPPPFDPLEVRRIWVTGLGSSAAQARLLAHCLCEYAELDARFLPSGALHAGPPDQASRDALLVFSQGLSPNARFALQSPARWRALGLATAVSATHRDPERLAMRERVEAAGGWLVTFPGEDEYDGLMRVTGPLTGGVAALRMAAALTRATGRDAAALAIGAEMLEAALRRAPDVAAGARAGLPDAALDAPVALLASGGYAELLGNLQLKFLEGLLRPLPPAWDVLDFAHGPFQQAFARRATFLALHRPDAAGEADLFARLDTLLDPQRHCLVELPATLPGPWALLEHDAQLSAWVVSGMQRDAIHPDDWPGRGRDAALYELRPETGHESPPASREPETRRAGGATRRLATATWPEVEARLADERLGALLPLGATEQHGPHLPFATDTWIAEALAERLCTRLDDAVSLPALPVGCSSEHRGFPGTLSLSPATLAALLDDLIAGLASDGFARVFLFSAHGGNCPPLAQALPELRDAHPGLRLDAFTDLAALARLQQSSAAAFGISAEAAGHHAGEFETSILRALRPALVRGESLEVGRLHADPDAQHLFYPDLRAEAPKGTVGDPRGASALRAERYLNDWVDLLERAYRSAGER